MAALPLAPSSNDQSVDLIGQVFGSNWQHLLDGGGGGSATQTIIPNGGALFGDLFLVANSIALAIAGLLIVYTVVVGAMSTAHEGEAMGRRFHTLWAPVRSAFAIALLMPLAGGYSLLQAGILYFASLGIGAADAVWGKGLDYIASSQGVIVSPPTSRVDNLANGVLKSLVCEAYLNKQAPNYGLSALIAQQQTVTPSSTVIGFDGVAGSGLDTGACGQITVRCSKNDDVTLAPLVRPICEGQVAATVALIDLLRPVANQIVADQTPPPNQIEDAVGQFDSIIKSAIATAIGAADGARSARLAEFVSKAQSQGWASAGSWYWTISRLNQSIANAANNLPAYTGPTAPANDSMMGAYLTAVDGYIQTHGSPIGTPSRDLAQVGRDEDSFGAMMNNLAKAVTPWDLGHVLTPGMDPIANMQSLGTWMIDGAGLAAGAVAATKIFTPPVDGKEDGLLKGFGMLGKMFSKLIAVVPILILIVTALLTFGMALAYYLPSVPFILWTLGVVGYLVLLVESMVAAPLWAIGHAIPEGDGLAGQHGKQGYMLFLNVIARPTLMVFGFFAAILILWGASTWASQQFQTFASGLQAETFTGLLAYIALTGVIGGLMIAAAHMCFRLVYEVPDRVLRWIGGGGAQLGESGGEHKANQHFTALGGVISHSSESIVRRHGAPPTKSTTNDSAERNLQLGEAEKRKTERKPPQKDD